MSKKIGNNEKCTCGSGKKYKKCCKLKTANNKKQTPQMTQTEWIDWMERVSKLPFRAEIRSEKGSSGSMTVGSASVTKDGVTAELFNDPITLSTNQGDGERTENAYAILSIPQNKETKPEVLTGGNANVKNINNPYKIAIKDNPKELKIKSSNGLFAIIKIVARRDCGFDCFDILFGEAGRAEIISEDGNKQRPHLTIYPDGNNKFFRLAGYKCQMEGKLEYEANNKTIYPLESIIVFDEYSERLVLSFTYTKDTNTVELVGAEFK
jgi:hypothetical protein